MDYLTKYREIINKYYNGDFGQEILSLNQVLERAGEPDLLKKMSIDELTVLIQGSTGSIKTLFENLKEEKIMNNNLMEQTAPYNQTNDIVLDFIHKRFPKDCNWLDGNCYYFAVILKTRFPYGEILYDTFSGHFVTAIGGVNYDWSGIVPKDDTHYYITWDEFDKYDPYQKERIEIGCIR